jgi:hypothetical protein
MLIPKNLQCRIVAALLNGRLPEGYTLGQLERLYIAFDEPWRTYLGPLLDAQAMPAGVERASFINSYVGITPEHRDVVSGEVERSVHVPPLDELALPEIEWLWEGWIPRGMLTLFGAMPSAGKSYVALDLARRVIAGTTFPDGTPVPEGGPVIFIDAENVPQIHNRRATAWGMDRSQLYLMGPGENRLMIDLSREPERDRLVEWAWAKRPILIVVDSLSSVTTRGENKVEDVRDIFIFLNRVALDYGCGMLVIHHLRKPGAQFPSPKTLTFHELRGSSHITAMSRSIIGLHWVQTGPRRDLNDPRRMEVLKTNLCRYPEALGVAFRTLEKDPQVAEIVYGDVPTGYQEPTRQAKCAGWLLGVLREGGELPPAELVSMAAEAGFSRATLFRARRELGAQVLDTRGRRYPDNKWALAPDVAGRKKSGDRRPASSKKDKKKTSEA